MEEETYPTAEPLLVLVMQYGTHCKTDTQDRAAALQAAQQRFLAGREHLPGPIRALGTTNPPFPVSYSIRIEELAEQIRQSFVKTART